MVLSRLTRKFIHYRSYAVDRINPEGFQNPQGLIRNFFKQLRKSCIIRHRTIDCFVAAAQAQTLPNSVQNILPGQTLSFFPLFLPVNKPDGAGRPEFAVKFRIAAEKTFLAQMHIVLHAQEVAFSVRMTDTFSHICFTPFLGSGLNPLKIPLFHREGE